ncbi:hypothetical protein JQM64_06865 [Fournierella massiliensis]|nr:putative ABC transporter permease [Fournierella massiliensis]MCF2557240.1 hypothetical protein [Fournierella massiliensis]
MFDLYQAVGLFFLYAFLGWCVEVAFVAVTCGRVVNRGFLNGPVCPIYGFGMLGVLYLLRPVEENLLLLFLGGMVLASALELAGGWALNRLFHTRWWDYSNEPFNLGGYICLKFSLMWGLGTVMVVRLVHPALYDLFLWIPRRLGVGLEVVLTLIFLADLAATVVTVMGLERDLKELHELAGTLRRGSDMLTQKVGGAAQAADTRLDEGRLEWQLAKAEGREEWKRLRQEWEEMRRESRQELEERLAGLQARSDQLREKLLQHRTFGENRLLRAFPGMKRPERQPLLESLQEELSRRLRQKKG